jgi:butyryl-CoA dehydrogenase
MKDFDNKVVVITGAGSGMGRHYAIEFAKRNAKLALCDINQQGLDETVNLAKAHTQNPMHSEVFSVADETAVHLFAANTKDALGNAHIVINNAGIEGEQQAGWKISTEGFKRVMDINFYGVVYGTQAFLPQLAQNQEAALINVSSVFGLVGVPVNGDYCASKFAVRGFTEALMAELHYSHIQVHLLHPGGINTNISREKSAASHEYVKEKLITPPEEVVDYVIKAILTNKPRMVTGHESGMFHFLGNLVPIGLRKKLISDKLPASMKSLLAFE